MQIVMATRSAVENFLEKIGLESYRTRFLSQGYDTIIDLCLLDEDDLDSLSIQEPVERYKILDAASCIDVADWLQHLGLDNENCYLERLRAEGITTIRDVKSREWSDELLDSLEIMIPGHRKRVTSAATFLKWHSAEEPDTRVVVLGYWGQPPGLEDNPYPFLCVPGHLKSDTGEGARSSELTVFIVDSGSDVVTATESLIANLQLEYLRNVDSRGPYSAADKPLYRGVLKLGTEEFEVEVIPEKLASVGHAVMRKFKHYIDGKFHRWLKEDKPEETQPPHEEPE